VYRVAIEGGLEGPVNAVAPERVRQRELARELGAVLHRPAVAPAPAAAVRLLLGEEADLVLHGQLAVSRKLAGFEFRFPRLRAPLEDALR
jgi:NAD dependent epimerase/dehydratase family enzyme